MKKLVAIILVLVLSTGTNLTVGAAAKMPTAVQYIESQLEAQDKTFYVYKDFVDGRNNFTQKAWMGSNLDKPPTMEEFATGYSGTSSIRASLDITKHSWGGYMFINGVLHAGETTPRLNFGEEAAGINLTGARKLAFYARGEKGGEVVEFFMGGLGYDGNSKSQYADSTAKISTGFVTLTKEWKRYEILLAGKDIDSIGCGFGWVSNGINNPGVKDIAFYMDEIHYEYEMAQKKPLFLQSYASSKPRTDEAIINNFAYVYDNAAAVLALTYGGKHQRARQIADAMVYAQSNDRYFTDGRLRNAYMSGIPASAPGWRSGRNQEFARIPGFYDSKDQAWYEDYYAVSTSTGNMAWAALALCAVYETAPENKTYLQSAQRMGDFILTLKDNRGGFYGGYEGWEGSQTKATYKSTEHCIDLIPLYTKLASLSKKENDTARAEIYSNAAEHARSFVLSMYDSKRGCFYTGTTADGVSVNREVLPLDTNTWAVLALGNSFNEGDKVMRFVESNMGVNGGYDFNSDRDGIWFEGTAQVALVYKLQGNTKKYNDILALINQNRLYNGSIYAADRNRVTTGFLVSGTKIPWTYSKRQHLGATAWLAFAQLGKNPLAC